jgi:hypothetical protein
MKSMNKQEKLVPWVTFALVHPYWHLPERIVLPYHFSEGVSYRAVPQWVLGDDTVDELKAKVREETDDGVLYCIAVDYKAAALGFPDPNSPGPKHRAIQETATELIRFVNLALWLARPTQLGFCTVVHADKHSAEWVTRQIITYDQIRALEQYGGEQHTLEDFQKACLLFESIRASRIQGIIRTALLSTVRALVEDNAVIRFTLLWMVLECLFGVEEMQSETSFRISQRMALFLEQDKDKRPVLFGQIKKSYSWRSKIVHGLRVTNISEEDSQSLLLELETFVRSSLLAILGNQSIAETFDGKGRERFLDGLAYA